MSTLDVFIVDVFLVGVFVVDVVVDVFLVGAGRIVVESTCLRWWRRTRRT